MSNLQNISSLKFIYKTLIISGLMLCSLVFSLSAYASTTEPTKQTIEDSYYLEAENLLVRGRFEDAYEVYRRLFKDNPSDDRVVLGFAISANRTNKWNQALMAYEMLLERYPNDPDLLAELINIYMLLGNREAADRNLAHAQSLGQNILTEDSLDKLEERYNTLQVNGNVRLGVMYDTNVNGGPANENITLGNWQVSIPGSTSIASAGGYAAANLDLAWKKYRDSRLWIVATGNLYARNYLNHELAHDDIRDSQWAKANLGVRYMSARHLLDVRAKTDIFAYQFDQNVISVGPEITYYFLASPTDSLYTSISLDYQRNTDSLNMSLDDGSSTAGKDGWYGKIAQHWRHNINNDFSFTLGFAGLYGNVLNKKFPQYDYQGVEGSLSFEYITPIDIILNPTFSASMKNYEAPNTLLESENREDIKVNAGLGARYSFGENWHIEAVYNYTKNMSNSALAEYEQHAVTSGLSWSF